jgi:prepilin-type N-terminal cleavage/methylation domain-containing protein
MRKNAGFTAFELAVSMAIMAVIAALALPPYLQWLRGHRLRGAVTNLMGDMEMAKIRAIRENDYVVVRFAQNSYTIFLDNGQPSGTAGDWNPAGESIIKTRILPADVKFNLDALNFEFIASAGTDDITRFNGRGLPDRVSAPTVIPLFNQSQSSSITINRLGLMSVQ